MGFQGPKVTGLAAARVESGAVQHSSAGLPSAEMTVAENSLR